MKKSKINRLAQIQRTKRTVGLRSMILNVSNNLESPKQQREVGKERVGGTERIVLKHIY